MGTIETASLVVPPRLSNRCGVSNRAGKRERDFGVKGDERYCQIRKNWEKALA